MTLPAMIKQTMPVELCLLRERERERERGRERGAKYIVVVKTICMIVQQLNNRTTTRLGGKKTRREREKLTTGQSLRLGLFLFCMHFLCFFVYFSVVKTYSLLF